MIPHSYLGWYRALLTSDVALCIVGGALFGGVAYGVMWALGMV